LILNGAEIVYNDKRVTCDEKFMRYSMYNHVLTVDFQQENLTFLKHSKSNESIS